MKAWLIEKDGATARLVLRDVPELVPGPDDLLVGVRAVGLNRADLGLNAGHYARIASKPPHPVAGLEAAGEVIGVGSAVTGWSVGDRVMGMPAGAYAEQALIDHRLAVRMPAGFDFVRAAAIPVALFTAHDAVVTAGRLARGDTLFIQGAASGVGIAAIQIARALGASAIIGTASVPKHEKLRALGMTHCIDYAAGGVVEAVLAATGGAGADVILDMVGAKAIADHIAMAALGARWVQIGRMGGISGPIDLNELSRKRLSLIGVSFRARDVGQFAALVNAAWRDCGQAVAEGRFAMPVDRVFPFAEADRAQAAMRENRHFGKLILAL